MFCTIRQVITILTYTNQIGPFKQEEIHINSEGRITMLWSVLMWFSSLDGVSKISKNNLITSCIGGIFLAVQKRVHNLRLTTTEPLEHTFGTTRSWRREFTINEFLSYSNKIDIILKNVTESGIRMSTAPARARRTRPSSTGRS